MGSFEILVIFGVFEMILLLWCYVLKGGNVVLLFFLRFFVLIVFRKNVWGDF